MNGISSSRSSSEMWRTITNCAGGGAPGSTVLRFRPIAPKPATWSSGSRSGYGIGGGVLGFTSGERRKRKYVRVRRNGSHAAKKKTPNDGISRRGVEENKCGTTVLQLLPHRPLDLDRPMKLHAALTESGYAVEARVTVESVVATWTTAEKLDDRTVQAWVMSLECDTCPGFLSDGADRVTWMNGGFRKMVTAEEGGAVVAMLVIKERFPSYYSSFSGHVKLEYYCYREGGSSGRKMLSRVVPCDMWRMDGGGFAWRLDVDSALTLGRT